MQPLQFKPLNTVATVQMEILSPVHIGTAGEKLWIQNIDYFDNGKELIVLDQDKLIRALSKAKTIQNEPALMVYQDLLAGGKRWQIDKFLSDCGIESNAVAKVKYPLPNEPAAEIRPLVRTGMNQPIIPGSSIKGAIRTAILHKLYQRRQPEDRKIEEELLGKIDNNIMRYIRPYDAPCSQVGIINIELFNLYQEYGNWVSDYKQQFLITTEAFLPKATATFSLGVADGLLDVLQKHQQTQSSRRHFTPRYAHEVIKTDHPIEYLFEVINEYTRTHLEREIAFFKKYNQAEDVAYIIDNLENYRDLAGGSDPKQCLLRLAFGTGFHGITGELFFPDHTRTITNPDIRFRKPQRYKSRKVTGFDIDATLMGFVKLKI